MVQDVSDHICSNSHVQKESGDQKAEEKEDHDDLKEIVDIQIGDRCSVTWRDGSKKVAVIVEKRIPNGHKRSSSPPSSCEATKTRENEVEEKETYDKTKKKNDVKSEYYVHYVDHDRRLDEWLTMDKFDLSTLEKTKVEAINSHDGSSRRSRRDKRRKTNDEDASNHGGGMEQSLAALEHEHEEITKVKNISKIVLGDWEVEAWYFSPYPEEYNQDTLLVCEFCLKYMKHRKTLRRHKAECALRRPPGKEIYREGSLSVFEVDGKKHRIYCQNLCLMAKLFLDHKTLYYDVEPFIFYIVTEVDERGAHIVGYFSKEKYSAEDYNLACILTFPQYQKCGYGKFIISLSYELSKKEKKVGSPEKPLSDLGKISYRSYWTHVLMTLLSQGADPKRKYLRIRNISQITAIKTEDIISTLQSLNMVKFWKGQHVVYVREEFVQNYVKQQKQIRLCKEECLHWGNDCSEEKVASTN